MAYCYYQKLLKQQKSVITCLNQIAIENRLNSFENKRVSAFVTSYVTASVTNDNYVTVSVPNEDSVTATVPTYYPVTESVPTANPVTEYVPTYNPVAASCLEITRLQDPD